MNVPAPKPWYSADEQSIVLDYDALHDYLAEKMRAYCSMVAYDAAEAIEAVIADLFPGSVPEAERAER